MNVWSGFDGSSLQKKMADESSFQGLLHQDARQDFALGLKRPHRKAMCIDVCLVFIQLE